VIRWQHDVLFALTKWLNAISIYCMGKRSRSLIRVPSIKKRIGARTSLKRVVRHNLGVKAPRGLGWFTNPRKALYNRVYSRSSIGCMVVLAPIGLGLLLGAAAIIRTLS
jgi:hypothetical protein